MSQRFRWSNIPRVKWSILNSKSLPLFPNTAQTKEKELKKKKEKKRKAGDRDNRIIPPLQHHLELANPLDDEQATHENAQVPKSKPLPTTTPSPQSDYANNPKPPKQELNPPTVSSPVPPPHPVPSTQYSSGINPLLRYYTPRASRC